VGAQPGPGATRRRVRPGSIKLDDGDEMTIGQASLSVLWVPFDGTGGIPIP
jgi:hypothetical protein